MVGDRGEQLVSRAPVGQEGRWEQLILKALRSEPTSHEELSDLGATPEHQAELGASEAGPEQGLGGSTVG